MCLCVGHIELIFRLALTHKRPSKNNLERNKEVLLTSFSFFFFLSARQWEEEEEEEGMATLISYLGAGKKLS